jgi:hypothetical protein
MEGGYHFDRVHRRRLRNRRGSSRPCGSSTSRSPKNTLAPPVATCDEHFMSILDPELQKNCQTTISFN